MSPNLKRLVRCSLVSFALLVGLASPAEAVPPLSGEFATDAQFVDDGASAACGFDVTVSITGTGSYTVLLDHAGNPVRAIVHENSTGTMSANGISLREADHNTQFFDFQTGTTSQVGIVFREFLPGYGVVIMDRGRLTAAADGTLTFEAGPHPALDGDFAALCAALTP